jgi:serine protease Do
MGENKPFLGVTTDKEGDGAKITEVSEGSAAGKAGLKEGDIIIRINDQKVTSPEDLSKAVGKYKPEEKVTVVYKRDGKEQSQSVALGKRKNVISYSTPGMDHAFNFDMGNGNSNNYRKLQDEAERSLNLYSRAKLGIKAQETEEGKGVKVLEVGKESTAEKAGVKEGDIITEFDGTEVNDVDKLRELALLAAAKTSFKIKLVRDGKPQEILVKIPKKLKTTNL